MRRALVPTLTLLFPTLLLVLMLSLLPASAEPAQPAAEPVLAPRVDEGGTADLAVTRTRAQALALAAPAIEMPAVGETSGGPDLILSPIRPPLGAATSQATQFRTARRTLGISSTGARW